MSVHAMHPLRFSAVRLRHSETADMSESKLQPLRSSVAKPMHLHKALMPMSILLLERSKLVKPKQCWTGAMLSKVDPDSANLVIDLPQVTRASKALPMKPVQKLKSRSVSAVLLPNIWRLVRPMAPRKFRNVSDVRNCRADQFVTL